MQLEVFMRQQLFGALVATAVSGLVAGTAAAEAAKTAKPAKGAAAKVSKCVICCSGYAV
jgi:hypothetical protein